MELSILFAIVPLVISYFAFYISKKAKQINIRKLIFYRKAYRIILELTCILFVIYISSSSVIAYALIAIYLFYFRWTIPWFKPIYNHTVIDEIDSFILYLRSFQDDRSNKFGLSERKIVKLLNRIFPVYAVGSPTELLPAAGAKRIYIADDWQNKIEVLADKAKFILLKISETENFLWECKLCFQKYDLDKLIFFCTSDTKNVYNKFQNLVKTSFCIDLPDYDSSLTKDFFIYFVNGVAVLQDYSFKKNNNIESIAIRFLDDHPKLNEENERYLKNKKKLFLKLFSLKKDKSIDKDLQKWSWAGFLLGWRLPNNYSYGTYLLFIFMEMFPALFISIIEHYLTENNIALIIMFVVLQLTIMCFWGYNGSKLSWLSKQWDGKKYFQRIQKKWNIAGIIILTLLILVQALDLKI